MPATPPVTTEIQVSNMALRLVGSNAITADTDPGPQAELHRIWFAPARDSLLRAFPWSFATTRGSLEALASAPAWGFQRQFPLPDDALRILEVNGSEDIEQWRVEANAAASSSNARVLVTDFASPAEIRFIRRVTEIRRMDAQFIVLLAHKLALHWAEPLAKSAALYERIRRDFVDLLREAASTDSFERSNVVTEGGTWNAARFAGDLVREGVLPGPPQSAF